jgi:hypothetical protein
MGMWITEDQIIERSKSAMFKDLLKEKQREILESWRDQVFDTYPHDAVKFLSGQKDRFANPVGHFIHTETEAILNGLIDDVDPADLAESLDKIIRIRSVQDFSPSQAVSFLRQLKDTVREKLNGELSDRQNYEQHLSFDSRIDSLIDLAFDIYSKCREQVFEIKVNEVKKRSAVLFERASRSDKHEIEKNNPNDSSL